MDLIRLVEFDIRGTNPVNKFVGEKMPIEDKTCPYLIPNASPFFDFPQTLIVYNQAGGELRRDVDYWLEGEFTPFCELSGKKVVTFVKLSPTVLALNEFVSITYQSIGANFVPRNSLKEWLTTLNIGKIPIPFHKVMSVPATLPASLHMHNAKTEITDWYELTYFFHTLANISSSVDMTLPDRANTIITGAFNTVFQSRDNLINVLNIHDGNTYNPHGVTKAHLQLGNHDNFHTATVTEDIEGVRSDLFSTPMGVQEMVKDFIPDTDEIMRSGVAPVSQFGGISFIPPNISGSFEAIGEQDSYSFGMKEQNGEVLWLMSRIDGRVEGLYFSVIDPVSKEMLNTGYKYQHPYLTLNNVNPDFIANTNMQSDVMIVGDSKSNKMYAVKLNGTLDPAKHVWSEIDTNPIRRTISTAPTGTLVLKDLKSRFSAQEMGDSVYLFFWSVHSSPGVINGDMGYFSDSPYRYLSFLKFPMQSVGVVSVITPAVQNLTYTDCHGVSHVDKDRWTWAEPVKNGSDQVTKYVLDWAPYWNNPRAPLRYQVILTEEKLNTPGVFYIKIAAEAEFANSVNLSLGTTFEYIAEFNINTGVMSLIKHSTGTKNLTDASSESFFKENSADGSYRTSTYKFLSKEIFTTSQTSFGYRHTRNIPQNYVRLFFNELTLSNWDLYSKKTGLPLFNGLIPKDHHPVLKDGYFFNAYDKEKVYELKRFYRKAPGKLQQRPGITNLDYSNLISQSLSNDIKEVLVPHIRGCASVIVADTQLDAFDVDIGDSSFCIGAIPKYEGSVLDDGKDINLHTDYRLDPVGLNALIPTPLKTITYPESIVELLKLEIQFPEKIQPGDEVGVVITDPTDGRLTDRFGWLPVIVHVTALISSELMAYNTVLVIEPVYSAGVVTSYTVVRKEHSSEPYGSIAFGTSSDYRHNDNRKTLYFIKNNTLEVRSSSGLFYGIAGTGSQQISQVTYSNRTNKTISLMQSIKKANSTAGRFAFIPSVGAVYSIDAKNYGYTCEVFETPTGAALLTSQYPETGWIVYLPDRVKLLINGTHYEVPGGTIDLRNVEQDPANKTFYVYVTVQETTPTYIFSTTKLRRNLKLLLVAVIVTGPTQILTIERRQPFIIGGYELSTVRAPGTIPVSSGISQDEGTFIFLKESELVP